MASSNSQSNDPADAMEEQAKAIQEIAKATGKAVDAATEVGRFIARFVAGSVQQGMGIVEDRLRYMRWERSIRLSRRAEEMLNSLGLEAPSRPVPMSLAIPIFEGASLEEDDALQDRWAALLVNAANASSNIDVRRAYCDILEQLTPLDACILDAIYALPFEASRDGVLTADLPTLARIAPEGDEDDARGPSTDVEIALSNLVRVGCLRPQMTYGGGERYKRVSATVMGRSFIEACSIKR
jgi:hypothetical protein